MRGQRRPLLYVGTRSELDRGGPEVQLPWSLQILLRQICAACPLRRIRLMGKLRVLLALEALLRMTSYVHASSETQYPQAKASYTFADIVQICCICFFSIYAISPPLLVNGTARIAAILAVGLFLIVEIIKRPETFLRPSWITVITVIYAIYANVFGYMADGLSDTTRNFELNVFLFCIIILESYRRRSLEHLKWPALGVCIVSVAWLLTTLTAMEAQRNVARLTTRTSEESLTLMSSGVGGFSLTYFACAMIPTLIYFVRAKNVKPGWIQIPAWIYLGIISLLVIRAGFFIALLFGTAAAIISIFYVKGTREAFLQAVLALAALLGIGLLASSQLRDAALDWSSGTMYERKVEDATEFLASSTADGTVGVRAERYQRSLEVFAENPLLGVSSVQDVGKHSQILDSLARFGLIMGGLLPLLLLLVGKEFSKRYFGTTGFPMVAVTLLLVLGLALFNNITMSLGIVAFIIMPAAVHVITKGEKATEEVPLISTSGGVHGVG